MLPKIFCSHPHDAALPIPVPSLRPSPLPTFTTPCRKKRYQPVQQAHKATDFSLVAWGRKALTSPRTNCHRPGMRAVGDDGLQATSWRHVAVCLHITTETTCPSQRPTSAWVVRQWSSCDIFYPGPRNSCHWPRLAFHAQKSTMHEETAVPPADSVLQDVPFNMMLVMC